MYFRLTQVDIQDGKMEDTLAYASSVMDSLKDTPGLFQICIAEMDNGQMTSWTLWANEDSKNASIDKFNEALAGAAEMLDGQPEVMEGPMVAGQQYIAVSKEGGDGFFARFVLGGGTQECKTYDDVAEFMTNTVYPAYENVEGIYGTGACKVAEDKGFSFNFWTDHDAAHAASDVIASVVSDAVANLISEPPQEITGQCNIWKNYVDFPVGKL